MAMTAGMEQAQPGLKCVLGLKALVLYVPPDGAGQIGKIVFPVLGLDGSTPVDYTAQIESFEADGDFRRHRAMAE